MLSERSHLFLEPVTHTRIDKCTCEYQEAYKAHSINQWIQPGKEGAF